MAHSLGAPVGAEWRGTTVSRAGSWEIRFLSRYSSGASDQRLDLLGRSLRAEPWLSLPASGTPHHMVKHVDSAATLRRFEP